MSEKEKKRRKYYVIRARYEAKRHTEKWKMRKRRKRNATLIQKYRRRRIKRIQRKPKSLHAPKIFSLIENPDETLSYFDNAEKRLRSYSVVLDISDVEVLTPPTLLLLVASVNDIDFTHGSIPSGNAPKKPELARLFTESGFYDYVRSKGEFKTSKDNLLHKEVNKQLDYNVAADAMLTGVKHIFKKKNTFEPLYEILVECMTNTKDHADLKVQGKCNWWLYVYNFPDEDITSYSFLDLGVGIFESTVVKNYLKNFVKGTPLYRHINLVDDLLSGNIRSRVEKDNEIRGKGIPQIVENSKSKHFKSFYIIANDVMIDLKSGDRQELKVPLNGTLLYWELQK